MKILTAEQMRHIDARTEALGFPGLLMMENAGLRVLEMLEKFAAPLEKQRVVIFCGKGNNGGDGLVLARHLLTRKRPASLHVVLTADATELSPSARANLRMFEAHGGRAARELSPDMQPATLLVDAILGTGLKGPVREPALSFIRVWNQGFPLAKRVAIDVPSGMNSDDGGELGEFCKVDACVTFTALRHCHALPPGCDHCGEVSVGQIGTPEALVEAESGSQLEMISPTWLGFLTQPRDRASHKGDFGHVLVVGGSRGKSGAVGMAGIAALRSGAGLVTVATVHSAVPGLVRIAPELMSAPLAETHDGYIEADALDGPVGDEILGGKSVIAAGPGMGVAEESRRALLSLLDSVSAPLVLDADALNILALESQWPGDGLLVLTPHPGEMARLLKTKTQAIQANRVGSARELAVDRNATVVLKGQRTIVAFPDGEVWVNPTGTPAMATAGSGDILSGTIAATLAQFPSQPKLAVAAAVYLHGLAGEIGGGEKGEASLIATDLLDYYPAAIRRIAERAAENAGV